MIPPAPAAKVVVTQTCDTTTCKHGQQISRVWLLGNTARSTRAQGKTGRHTVWTVPPSSRGGTGLWRNAALGDVGGWVGPQGGRPLGSGRQLTPPQLTGGPLGGAWEGGFKEGRRGGGLGGAWGGGAPGGSVGGVLARSHGLVFSSAAGGAHWQIAIRCPSLPFPSVKVHQAAVLVRRFCFSLVAGCVDQNIKDPYGNTLHLHEVTFLLMAVGGGGCFCHIIAFHFVPQHSL